MGYFMRYMSANRALVLSKLCKVWDHFRLDTDIYRKTKSDFLIVFIDCTKGILMQKDLWI